ncbi:MAG: hypothetical protein Q4A36_00830 [Candidatus Saccharibacteria bacterium]|nr:hypothetical protein [Candidatus Saccharibacteria bacterium]
MKKMVAKVMLFVMAVFLVVPITTLATDNTVSADTLEAEPLEFAVEAGMEELIPAGTILVYADQPSWYMASGYDAIVAYITDDTGKYVQRCFFVTDGGDWLLYDYGELAAAEFFSKTEKNEKGMYIPVQKSATHKDNTKTPGIDESKIPLLTKEDFATIIYDWRALSDIPFTRDSSGKIEYALTEQKEEPTPTPTPTPTPSGEQVKYTVTVNNNVYDVYCTKEVIYNGRKHVLKSAKATKTQCPDLAISVYRNGEAVKFAVKFFNNVNVNGYGGKTPFFTIMPANKADRKVMAKNKFTFNILPVDIGKVNLSVKSVKFSSGAMTLNGATAKIDGLTYKLSPMTLKNKAGSYVASYKDGSVTVYGTNNYAGSTVISLSSARTISWSF